MLLIASMLPEPCGPIVFGIWALAVFWEWGLLMYYDSPRYEGRLRGLVWRNGSMVEPGGRDDVPWEDFLEGRTDDELDALVDNELRP